jgi:hypothetical protein
MAPTSIGVSYPLINLGSNHRKQFTGSNSPEAISSISAEVFTGSIQGNSTEVIRHGAKIDRQRKTLGKKQRRRDKTRREETKKRR